MRSKLFFQWGLAVLMFSSLQPAFSQTVPSAYQGSLPFTVGAGASNFDVDWSKTRMYGVTLWADWHPGALPGFIRGLGIELEARDISFDRPKKGVTPNFRMDTLGGGPIYTWHHFKYIWPYGKGLVSLGSFDFNDKKNGFNHNTEVELSPGLGLEFRTLPHLWVRADYEYQFWQPIFGKTPNPQGFSLGAVYDFGGRHRRL